MREKCDNCQSTFLIKLSTCKLEGQKKPGYMECSRCDHKMPWELDEGQKPLVSNNRLK